jgi:peptide/nickel transport system substrate-binding protein
MGRSSVRVLIPALGALALVVSACGGSSSSSSGGPQAPSGAAKKGGTLTVLSAADVDYIDPGLAYYTFSYEVTQSTQRPLYSYKPDNASTPVPDLAEGQPIVSKDGKTVTVHIKHGIRFSPPVNREVTSADVKYAMERAFTKNVPNGYATSYSTTSRACRRSRRAPPRTSPASRRRTSTRWCSSSPAAARSSARSCCP